jgi:hypothetical protein
MDQSIVNITFEKSAGVNPINAFIYSSSALSLQDSLLLKRACKSKLNEAAFSKEASKKNLLYCLAFASFRGIVSSRPEISNYVKEVIKDFEPKILSDYFTNFVRDTYIRKNGTAETLVLNTRNVLAGLGVSERSLDVVIERMRKAYRPKDYHKDVVG